MCRFISFKHNPKTGEIKVSDLKSHGNTELALNLSPSDNFRDGHYLPNGTVECRVEIEDGVSEKFCNDELKKKYPTFASFFNWCMKETEQVNEFKSSLYLSGCNLREITLPQSIVGSLDLRGCDLKGIKIPKKFKSKIIQ